MRLIDAEGSELQTQLKIIREAEYQIYGSGSWGFTTKCEHAIEDAPTIQPEPYWIPTSERLPKISENVLLSYFDEITIGWFNSDGLWSIYDGWKCVNADEISAWMPLPEPFKG